ncbi:MAG TPA: transporter [Sulfurimonas autotrophica]|nr:transporter [Sulfurimonas autotrophica]
MSYITAEITEIQSVQNLNIISLTCNTTVLKMMSLDLDETITIGSKVKLTCKPTSIAIGKDVQGEISCANQLHVKIHAIKVGQLLSALQLEFGTFLLESIITTDSQKRMHLQVGDEVLAFIKSSDISIQEVLA